MALDRFPFGLEMDVSYPSFEVHLRLLSVEQLEFEIKEGPFARIEGGKLAEHWDVLQNEVRAASGAAGLSMFDPEERAHRAPP